MQTKKTIFIIAFISTIFIGGSFMIAQAYEPLVRLPGLPTTGDINLSQYIIGLYNFLLSIVGIVAVMMLIIGGMKYITAAGNASIISDAKDTITNALFGLLLALLSWVIVSTINPDVLYIKDPAASFSEQFINDLGACGNYNIATAVCACKDGATPAAGDQEACEAACVGNCGITRTSPCIAIGQSEVPITNRDGETICSCVDGNSEVAVDYTNAPADAKCNEVCSNPDWAVDREYHGINWNLKVGGDLGGLSSGSRFSAKVNDIVYYDFSNVRDCRDTMIHIAVDFDGAPTMTLLVDQSCCLVQNNPSCGLTSGFGTFCNVVGGFIAIGMCNANGETDIFPPPNDDEYPIYKHTYNTVGLQHIWVGTSYVGVDGNCHDATEHLFEIDVVP